MMTNQNEQREATTELRMPKGVPSLSRQLLTWVALIATGSAGYFLAMSTNIASSLGLADFIAYWAAGRLNAFGDNPYSFETLLPLQQAQGWAESYPNMMYYPPWTLPLVMPFGVLSYSAARLLWLVIHLGIVLACADWLWRYYDGPARYRRWAWVWVLAFVPTLIALRMGQIGPLMLLGIVGFLHFEKRGHDWLAGAALLLPAVKPHAVYLFGLAVLVWAVYRRRWSILFGGIATALAAVSIAFAFNPHVLEQYRFALENPPSVNITPTFGALLRLVFGADQTWLQYMPSALGLLWFPFFWWQRREAWSWQHQAPLLLLVSFLTSAYGSWVFDLVILVVPILQVATWVIAHPDRRVCRIAVVSFLAIDAVALFQNLAGVTYPAFFWMTPALFASYLILGWQTRRYLSTQLPEGTTVLNTVPRDTSPSLAVSTVGEPS
jgi:hypothetical protein